MRTRHCELHAPGTCTGAVFGKFFSRQGLNAEWHQNKTVVGTLAVFVFAYLSLDVQAPAASKKAGNERAGG